MEVLDIKAKANAHYVEPRLELSYIANGKRYVRKFGDSDLPLVTCASSGLNDVSWSRGTRTP